MQKSLFESQQKHDTQVIQGVIERCSFRSAESDFAVMTVCREPNEQRVTCIGPLSLLQAGERLRLVGRWEEHRTHGKQFRVHSFVPLMPSSEQGIVRYLGSGAIPGVGPAIAQRIVDKFKERTFDVIATQSSRLTEVSGIGRARAQRISDALRVKRQEAEQLSFLHAAGLGPAMARRVARDLGENAAQKIKDNPYLLSQNVSGIGFRTADTLGQKIGIPSHDIRRARAVAIHLLQSSTEQGNSYESFTNLIEGAAKLDMPELILSQALQELQQQQLIRRDGEAIYLAQLYQAEIQVSTTITDLVQRPALRSKQPTEIEANLHPEQQQAVLSSLKHRLLIVTGGPGTGKTTTIKQIVHAHSQQQRRVILCAPTGRAAKRLQQATGHDAKTIHRVLEWNPLQKRFSRNMNHPLEADTVIVDESSMVDLPLMQDLVSALPKEAHLVLVGDIDQLPPVGPGQVLRELIQSSCVPTIRLHHVFRQAMQSTIVRAAHHILRGEDLPTTPKGSRGTGDVFVVTASGPEQTNEALARTLRRIEQVYDLDPRTDVQVIAPMRKGSSGTDAINLYIRQLLNPHAAVSNARFCIDDKVMQLRNDYDKDVFNGDVGFVQSIQQGQLRIRWDTEVKSHEGAAVDALTLAYACTVHKSQGSEYPAVVLILQKAHTVLASRPMIYTALTRARRLAVIIAEPDMIKRSIRRQPQRDARCRLAARIRQLVTKD